MTSENRNIGAGSGGTAVDVSGDGARSYSSGIDHPGADGRIGRGPEGPGREKLAVTASAAPYPVGDAVETAWSGLEVGVRTTICAP